MNITVNKSISKLHEVVIIPVFETDLQIHFHSIALSQKLFSGKKDTHYILEQDNVVYFFIGLGESPDYKSIKTAFRRISAKQKNYFKAEVTLVFDDNFNTTHIEAAVVGLLLGTYRIDYFKTDKSANATRIEQFSLDIITTLDIVSTVEKAKKIANAQLETMRLVDLPPNTVNPQYLASWAIQSGKKYGFDVTVFNREQATQQGLHAFLSVGRAGASEPQFIIMQYRPANAKKHIGFVGKGITFDTGGLNIKTQGMVYMKSDMAGAAAVLGAVQLIADCKLPYQITAIIPACENAIGSNSYMPSDVIQSYSGKSIEIIDTDAEGRLILADGISYLIKNYNPDMVVDVATLTGSAVGTFGYECAAMFTNDDALAKKLQECGQEIGERVWQLPLWDSYKPDIESEIADVKNYSGKPVAGAISAAKFLEYFTENHTSWVHLDIAGVAFIDDEFAKTKHASGYGVHLLTKLIERV